MRVTTGSPEEQRQGLYLGTRLKRLPVDGDVEAYLSQHGRSRDDFSPLAIRFALRTFSHDELGRKTAPDWERALMVATWYLEPAWGVSPFDHTVLNELWKILGEAGRADRILALYEEGKRRRGVKFGEQIVVPVVKSLFAGGYHQQVVDVLDEAQEHGWEVPLPDETIQSQVHVGLLGEALTSFNAAAQRATGAPVLLPTYTALLKAGIPWEVLRSGKNDCDLARALGQMGKTDEAVRILRDAVYAMRRDRFFPVHLWLDAVVAAVDIGRVDEAEDFRERGARNKNFVFEPALGAYIRHRHVLASHRTILTLLGLEPRLNVQGIGPALISMLCASEYYDQAVEILDAMLAQGTVPFPRTFGKIIKGLINEGRIEDAEAVLDSYYQHVEAQPDPQLSIRIFDVFVRRYLRVKQPERVLPMVMRARAHKQVIPTEALSQWAVFMEKHRHRDGVAMRKFIEIDKRDGEKKEN